MTNRGSSLIAPALMKQEVSAAVIDCDHYRIRGGMAVETDYIISVQPTGGKSSEPGAEGKAPFEQYKISKSYSAFRTLAHQLKKIAQSATKKQKSWDSLSPSAKNVVKLSESVLHLVDSQRTEYLGKVNFGYVKSLAKQRSQIINDILDLLLENYPKTIQGQEPFVADIATAIEAFFLTDVCEEEEEAESTSPGFGRGLFTPSKKQFKKVNDPASPGRSKSKSMPSLKSEGSSPARTSKSSGRLGSLSPPVVPISRKTRRSILVRAQDEDFLKEAGAEAKLLLDDDRDQATLLPSYSNPITVGSAGGSRLGDVVENNPFVFMAIAAAAIVFLKKASATTVTMDTDIAMLVVFAFFCLGFHMPRPIGGVEKPPPVKLKKPVVAFQSASVDRSATMLLRKSMSRRSVALTPTDQADVKKSIFETIEEEIEAEVEEGGEDILIISPLPTFPKGAELGTHYNCSSEPPYDSFKVRGGKYLQDSKKVLSGPFIFPSRGVDLFLTDMCPENVGSNSGVLGGNLRDVPTFIINFRLPWGVLLFYFEIPETFLPFLYKRYDPAFDDSKLPSLEKMPPGERAVCRFLMEDDDYKNARLKIVPVVVKGPWIVRSVVGGKPAILGNKLPVNYVYQPPEPALNKAAYLEADLDIVASSAARGILSVTQSATQELTMDLGFVVQGNSEDELPEQMLTGTRMHGIDPFTASPLPPMKNFFMNTSSYEGDD